MPDEFPMIPNAGRHMDYNVNTLMRNPEWKRACTVAVSPNFGCRESPTLRFAG